MVSPGHNDLRWRMLCWLWPRYQAITWTEAHLIVNWNLRNIEKKKKRNLNGNKIIFIKEMHSKMCQGLRKNNTTFKRYSKITLFINSIHNDIHVYIHTCCKQTRLWWFEITIVSISSQAPQNHSDFISRNWHKTVVTPRAHFNIFVVSHQ